MELKYIKCSNDVHVLLKEINLRDAIEMNPLQVIRLIVQATQSQIFCACIAKCMSPSLSHTGLKDYDDVHVGQGYALDKTYLDNA